MSATPKDVSKSRTVDYKEATDGASYDEPYSTRNYMGLAQSSKLSSSSTYAMKLAQQRLDEDGFGYIFTGAQEIKDGAVRVEQYFADRLKSDIEYDQIVTHVRPRILKRPSFTPLQEWEGYVTDVGDATFTADLADISTIAQGTTATAEFLVDDLSVQDLRLLRVGAIFRWTIGYKNINGTKSKLSQIVFRNLPVWSEKDLVEAEQEALDMYNFFNNENSQDGSATER